MGRIGIVNQLYNYIDACVIKQQGGIGGKEFGRGIAFFFRVLDAHLFDLGMEARCVGQYFIQAFAYHAEADGLSTDDIIESLF